MRPADPNLPQSLRSLSARPPEVSKGPEVAELDSILTLDHLEEINAANDRRRLPRAGPAYRPTELERLMLELAE